MASVGGKTEAIAQDKFLIQTFQFEAGTAPPDVSQLTLFWKELSVASVQEHRWVGVA